MYYRAFLLILTILFSFSTLKMYWTEGGKQFFEKKSLKIFFSLFLFCFTLGTGKFLERKPFNFSPDTYLWFIVIFFFLLGIMFVRELSRGFSWAWKGGDSVFISFNLSMILFCFCGLSFFVAFWMVEKPFFQAIEGLAEDYTYILIIAYIPYGVFSSFNLWKKMPRYIQELLPYVPDIKKAPSKIEFDYNGIPFFIRLTLRHGVSTEQTTLSIRAPRENSLDQVFLNALQEYNARAKGKKMPIIEVKDGDSLVFGWVFYRLKRKWWFWTVRYYINPFETLSLRYISPNEILFAERMRMDT